MLVSTAQATAADPDKSMGSFSSWILHEDQKEWFEYLFAVVVNAVFLVVVALVLWPLDRLALAWDLTKGYWAFWGVLLLTGGLLVVGRRILRVNMDDHFDAYLISASIVSGLVQLVNLGLALVGFVVFSVWPAGGRAIFGWLS